MAMNVSGPPWVVDIPPVSGGGNSSSRRVTNRAIWKPPGEQGNVAEGQGGSVARFMKIEMEAPFSAIRFWCLNRGPTGFDNMKFCAAATDDAAVSSATLAFMPRRSATTYNSIASSSSPLGWKIPTFGGKSVLSPRAYAGVGYTNEGYRPGTPTLAVPDIVVGDWLPIRSVDPLTTPASGIKRPLLVCGSELASSTIAPLFVDGFSTWVNASNQNSNYTAWVAGAEPWRRLRVAAASTGADAIGTGTVTVPTGYTAPPSTVTDTVILHFGIEVEFDVPVRGMAIVGDSNAEGYQWCDEAIAAVSTPEVPWVGCNLGMSTNTWDNFEATFHQFIAAGAPFTDILIPSHSHNDLGSAVADAQVPQGDGRNGTIYGYDLQRERIMRTLDLCDSLGIKVWLWTHFKGYNLTSPPEAETVIHLQWCRDLCAAGRAELVDITNSTYQAENVGGNTLDDDIHFTVAGRIRARDIFIAALQNES